MIPGILTADVIKRIATVQGQLGGIIKMIKKGDDLDKVLIQFKAATQGLHNAHHLLLDDVFRKKLALELAKAMEACPGNCQDVDEIEQLREQFPTLSPDELTDKIKKFNDINKRLEKKNKKKDK